jgi:manganese/zinc/iron transport system substrate-binding protein
MGPGIDPHLYRARESDVHALAAADIIFYNGLHLEGKMGHVLQGMHRFAHVVAVADSIDKNLLRISEFEDLYDPHIWFDVTLWMKVVGCIQKKLIEYDAENAEVYQKNGDEYSAQLALLHASLYKRMQDIPYQKRVLVTAHDAFGYFGRAYECEVVGLQGLSTDADINTKDIQLLADYIAHKKINAIFVESSIPQRALIAVQNAVHARGWSVAMGDELYSDSLGDETTYAHDYCGMMRYNVEVIACALVD